MYPLPQPRSPQPDRSAQLDQSPTQFDKSPTRLAQVQASTSQRAPLDTRESNALHYKASSIFASSVGKEVMTHPFQYSPQACDVTDTNAMYQKSGEMFGAIVRGGEAVSMSQHAECERDTDSMHRSATAKSGAYFGQQVRRAQRSARESRDDANAMHEKVASTMFATGSRDEAVRRDEAGTSQGYRDVPNAMPQKVAAVFVADAGLKVEASTDVMYQSAAAAYAASTSHLDELRTNHCRLLSKAW